MKKFATFDSEGILITRLVSGLHIVPPDAIEISDELFSRTMQENDGIWRLVDGLVVKTPMPDPEPVLKTQFSVLDFRERFTMPEQLAIRAAQMTDMEVGLVYDAFQAAQFIDVDDPRVAGGIDLYIAKGLLEPERKAELLAPQAA